MQPPCWRSLIKSYSMAMWWVRVFSCTAQRRRSEAVWYILHVYSMGLAQRRLQGMKQCIRCSNRYSGK